MAVIDHEPERFAPRLAADGVDELLLVPTPAEHFEAHVSQRALEELIDAERPALVLLGHTIDSLGFGPAVAARAGLGFATDVTSLSLGGRPVAARGAYGDKLVAELEFPGKDVHAADAAPRDLRARRRRRRGAAVAHRASSPSTGWRRPSTSGSRRSQDADVDITKAPFLISIGRGVEDKDEIPRFEALAERLGATLSVSRPLVDAGWMPSARQVGQSGKTVKPRVYLALGISGAVQHLAGMRTAETIIAVNTDPEAPIFGVAHYGAVADLFEVADELEQALGVGGDACAPARGHQDAAGLLAFHRRG